MDSSVSSIGSGIDITTLIDSLLELGAQPKALYDRREIEFESQITAIGIIETALSGFQDSLATLEDAASFRPTAAVQATNM